MSKTMLKLMAAAIGGLSLFGASLASAAPIQVTTDDATGWTWSFNPGTGSSGTAATNQPAQLTPPHEQWTAYSGNWLSWATNGSSLGYYGDYTFTYEVPLGDLAPGLYDITLSSVQFFSDNYVSLIQLDGDGWANPVTLMRVDTQNGGPGNADFNAVLPPYQLPGNGPFEFKATVPFTIGTAGVAGQPLPKLYVRVNVHNESTSDARFAGPNTPAASDTNPMGLVFKGDIDIAANTPPVPVPASVWGGLSLFGLMGIAKLRSRKQQM